MSPRLTSPGPVLPVPASAGANGALRIVIGTRELSGGENKPLVETSSLLISRKTDASADGVRPSATSPVASATRVAAPREKELVDPGLLTALQGAGLSADSRDPGLTLEEQRTVEAMQRRDSAVRQEEQTHAAQAGGFAGAPIYEYELGPDGKRYAVAGEVPVHIRYPTGDPEKLKRALAVISQAATSPTAPSAQDIAVSQQATGLAGQLEAQSENERAKVTAPPFRPNGTGRILDITG